MACRPLTVCAVRCGVAVTLVFHPDRAVTLAAGVSLAYGALSGLLAARALAILRQARPTLRAAPGPA